MKIEEASEYSLPFEHLRIHVKPEREKNRVAILREKWWQFKRTNQPLRKAIAPLSHYFTVPRVSKVQQIRETTQNLHHYRTQQMDAKKWGITQLYNKFFNEPTSQLFKLHAQLDKLVMQAYHFEASDDILEKLLELNLELAEKEKRGESVVGPLAPY